ncbi:ribosomal protein L1 [Phytophthora cinnamomi]|uniref:ribosomal protein L1 n=1 Tax=Phytophthora cinnamomi TaxID=4785 RepID=UPI003559D230|nr:ribosomal protein L1 [Phytophthora cinnamomi]
MTMRVLLSTSSAVKTHVARTSCWVRASSTLETPSLRPRARPPRWASCLAASNVPEVAPIDIQTALSKCKEQKARNFDETIDLAIQLGVDPRKPNQSVCAAS